MTHTIALNFEDGVTRFISTRPNETIADAAYRERINIPVDCRDGACGTCKSFCESGSFDAGSYLEDALSEEEASEGFCLPCQMRPKTDCVIRIPAVSNACKTGSQSVCASVAQLDRLSPTSTSFTLELTTTQAAELRFLPGQYVHLEVPGSGKHRAYSFCSAPGSTRAEFLIRNIPGGLMGTYLEQAAALGDRLRVTGPYGSFYLRALERPILMLAGGTGLAPFLSMLRQISTTGTSLPIHLIYGVTKDEDLVRLQELKHLCELLPTFSFTACVASQESNWSHKGFVTQHLPLEALREGNTDVYLCGPPPMVEAVRSEFRNQSVVPRNFFLEKFAPTEEVTK